MNVGEYGVKFLFGTGMDISAATQLQLVFTKPDATTLVVNNPLVAVGNVNVSTSAGMLEANTYVTYSFLPGDIDQAGTWGVRLAYWDSVPRKLISEPVNFEVEI